MGLEIAVCFARPPVVMEQLFATKVMRATRDVYAAIGSETWMKYEVPKQITGVGFFVLWSGEPIDLEGICLELSRKSSICVAWKSEHGGVAGYSSYRKGKPHEVESDSGDMYLCLPAAGVERTFGVDLGLGEEERLMFPEVVLDDDVPCFRLEEEGATGEAPRGTVRRLLEDDFDVEPVLPGVLSNLRPG